MGEIKIKSGNLYPIAIGEDTWNNLNDTTHSNNNGELIVVMGTVENSGIYSPSGSIIRTVHKDLSTYSWSVEIKADSPASLVIGFEGDGVKYFNITSEYQKLTFNNQSFISDRAFVMYNRTGVTRTVYLRNFMLNEGSTALPYQPYFLNHPAHQFTNGQFVDIPTHHYTNGRWQGELTSQSPLKFRADGEMLDWRVEGRTSGNLFDINGDIARESSGSIEISENQIIITVSATWGRDYVVFDKIFNPGLYTIKIISSSNTSGAPYSIGFLSTTPLPGWTYNEYYAAYVKDFDKNNTLIIRTTESMRIGFRCISSQTGQKVTLSNIKILEGAYTPETIPEDEPYGVGNWDETAKKYKIPIWVEGKNLFDGEWKQGTILSPSSAIRVSNKNAISLKTNTVYTIGVRGPSIIQYALVYRDRDGKVTYDSGWFSMAYPVFSSTAEGTTAEILIRRSDAGSITPVSEEILNLKVIFIEGTYTSSTIPLYEVNIYTDHQLLDGDSIDFTTDQTTIPLATGNNTLTVDTAVQPSKVFIKFEG